MSLLILCGRDFSKTSIGVVLVRTSDDRQSFGTMTSLIESLREVDLRSTG